MPWKSFILQVFSPKKVMYPRFSKTTALWFSNIFLWNFLGRNKVSAVYSRHAAIGSQVFGSTRSEFWSDCLWSYRSVSLLEEVKEELKKRVITDVDKNYGKKKTHAFIVFTFFSKGSTSIFIYKFGIRRYWKGENRTKFKIYNKIWPWSSRRLPTSGVSKKGRHKTRRIKCSR